MAAGNPATADRDDGWRTAEEGKRIQFLAYLCGPSFFPRFNDFRSRSAERVGGVLRERRFYFPHLNG
jgi:hypothetical protein